MCVILRYQVIVGKQRQFERGMERVIALMTRTEGHQRSHCYKQLTADTSYVWISEWCASANPVGFFRGEEFRRSTGWGSTQVVSTRPTMEVLGVCRW